MNNNESVLREAISTYGIDMQTDVAIEEMSELIEAICKWKRELHSGDVDKILEAENGIEEEIADVRIMIKQLEMIFECKEDVEYYEKYKIERLRDRLKHGAKRLRELK